MLCSPYWVDRVLPATWAAVFVMMLMTAAKALAPWIAALGPRITSMRSISSMASGRSDQYTAP